MNDLPATDPSTGDRAATRDQATTGDQAAIGDQAVTGDQTSTGDRAAPGGRPLLVGVDIGGTKIAALVVERAGPVRAREVAPTSPGAQDRTAEVVAAVIERALAAVEARIEDVEAVGVGLPGRVDPVTGTVTLAVNLGWTDLRLGQELEQRLGRPCVLENDVRAAALGLHRRGVVGDFDDLAYIAVGTGVSAGVILGGRLHRGSHGLAGEIGHVIADATGPRCSCGERGCLEAFVSGPAIARAARAAVARGEETELASTDDPTAIDVFRAAANGDRVAEEIVDAVGRRIAWAIHLVVMTYDVERVVLGGGVSQAGDTFLRPIEGELDRLRRSSLLAREQLVPGIVQLLPPGSDAGAWGAVTIAGLGFGDTAGGHQLREVGQMPLEAATTVNRADRSEAAMAERERRSL